MAVYARGEYMPMVWDGYSDKPPPEYIRGHVSDEEAMESLRSEYGDNGPHYPVESIKRRYARLVFAPADADYDRELRVCDHPSRGAFAVTEVRFKEDRNP